MLTQLIPHPSIAPVSPTWAHWLLHERSPSATTVVPSITPLPHPRYLCAHRPCLLSHGVVSAHEERPHRLCEPHNGLIGG